MKDSNHSLNSRRAFVGTLAAGVTAGISMMSSQAQAKILTSSVAPMGGDEVDKGLNKIGKKQHPVAYDVSQANPWGVIWSNIYYMTNQETGTPNNQLGVLNVLRHDGILYSFNDDLVKEYQLGKLFKGNDKSGNPLTRNPMYDPKDGDMPLPGLVGLKGLMERGAMVCVCNMAYKVYSSAVASKLGLNPDDVYNDFVAAKHPGIQIAPSGVWVLGRLAENGIAYIDASVG